MTKRISPSRQRYRDDFYKTKDLVYKQAPNWCNPYEPDSRKWKMFNKWIIWYQDGEFLING